MCIAGRVGLKMEEKGMLLLKDSGDTRTNDNKLLVRKKTTGKRNQETFKHETKEGLDLATQSSQGNHLERLFMFLRCDL